MNYEKKYKQLHTLISDLYPFMSEYCKEKVEGFFPELKESEDEKIRKELLEHCKNQAKPYIYTGNKCPQIQSWINWLEKQGEQKTSWSEEDEKKRTLLIRILEVNYPNGYFKVNPANTLNMEAIHIEELVSWLKSLRPQNRWTLNEEQGEENPANKVESKFHEGYWITNGDYTWKIVKVNPLDYILQSQDGNMVDDSISYVDKYFHLWTIQDCKPGDVLVASDSSIFVYTGSSGKYAQFYAAVTKYGDFNFEGGNWEYIKSVCPATKEQRDLLFAKMKETGYEWDAEKKERN